VFFCKDTKKSETDKILLFGLLSIFDLPVMSSRRRDICWLPTVRTARRVRWLLTVRGANGARADARANGVALG